MILQVLEGPNPLRSLLICVPTPISAANVPKPSCLQDTPSPGRTLRSQKPRSSPWSKDWKSQSPKEFMKYKTSHWPRLWSCLRVSYSNPAFEILPLSDSIILAFFRSLGFSLLLPCLGLGYNYGYYFGQYFSTTRGTIGLLEKTRKQLPRYGWLSKLWSLLGSLL